MVNSDALRSNDIPEGGKPGFVPTDEDLYWVGAMRDVLADSMRAGQTAALAVLGCALAGWIVVLIVLTNTAATLSAAGLIVWLLPLFWWSGSIGWALRVFTVRRYRYFSNSPDSAQKAIVRIARKKSDHLLWAFAFWLAGVLAVACAILHDVYGP